MINTNDIKINVHVVNDLKLTGGILVGDARVNKALTIVKRLSYL